ncbi:MAG: hydrogenase, partial [Desulfobacterales bacterium]
SRYPWPGNIRELENVIRYLLVVAEGRRIGVADFPEYIPVREADLVSKGGEQSPELPASVTYDQAETFEGLRFADMTWTAVDRAYALYLVDRYQWNLTRAAEAAGLNRSTFASRLRKMGIRRRG